MSTDHKISSLYDKLTTLQQSELNAAVKNVHHVILTLCRIDPTYFVGIDNTIRLTSASLSKLNDEAIIKYINTPVLLSIFHSRYHKDIATLLLTISDVFPFLLGFYEHIMEALKYLDNPQHDRLNVFLIIQLINDFTKVSTDDKVYVIKRIIIMLENIKRNLQNNTIVGDINVSDTKVSKWLNEVVSILSGLSTIMPIISVSEQLINDILEYIVKNKDILNDVLLKLESVGIDTLLDKSIMSLVALVNIVENSKGSVMTRDSVSPSIVTPGNSPKASGIKSFLESLMTRDSRNSVSPSIVTPGNSRTNSPTNSPKSGKKGLGGGGGKRKTRKNKRTKKRKPKRKTRK